MLSPLRRPWTVVVCLLALTLLTATLYAQGPQDVWTWHNDDNRTGWQQHETALYATGTGHVSQSNFGLLHKWPVTGAVFAQPLAIASVPAQFSNCSPNCDMVFIATEQDMLYAFNASSTSPNSSPLVWSLDLASKVSGSSVNCNALPPGVDYDPCTQQLLGDHVGVTGTPVIDMNMVTNPYTLYVVAAVQSGQCQNQDPFCFYLFAVDIRTGNPIDYRQITGTVNGYSPDSGGSNPPGDCTSTFPHTGQIPFDYRRIQRSALLLLPSGTVYVAFSAGYGNGDPHGETNNGWMFAYTLNNGMLGQAPFIFNSTPYGTGGGIWQSGGGPAYDGTYIYANTANGTLFDARIQTIPYDIGDSLLQIDPYTLAVTDFYSPYNTFSYVGNNGTGLCINDEDFGSGGVLAPSDFTYVGSIGGCNTNGGCKVVITADKQSKLYVSDTRNLGKFNSSDGNNLQTLLTPHDMHNKKQAPTQGYWASPAYWHYKDSQSQDHYMLYYSATTQQMTDQDKNAAPYPINGYQLMTNGTSGPIPDPPTASTSILFCKRSPTPSGSWDGSHPTTGIVWAIEHQNQSNPTNCNNNEYLGAALHAFNATDLPAAELYNSRHNNPQGSIGGEYTTFSTPTVFKGQVYVGTQTEVDVYGLCPQNGCP